MGIILAAAMSPKEHERKGGRAVTFDEMEKSVKELHDNQIVQGYFLHRVEANLDRLEQKLDRLEGMSSEIARPLKSSLTVSCCSSPP
jgi:hypothetical protein